MVNRKTHPHKFFTGEEKEQIVRAIRAAEAQTSGEIRVYLERKAKKDFMSHAQKVFEKLGMTRTKHRNGVLIYFSLVDHRFAILGDRSIHEKVGQNFWQETALTMSNYFSQDQFSEGLEAGISQIGARLKEYFPHERGDINELPDAV